MPAPQLERVLTACRLHQPSQRCAPPRIQHQCYRCVNPVRKVLPLRVSLYTHAMSATDPLKSRALTERQPWTLNRGYEPPRRGPATISGMSPVTQVCQDENTVAGWSGLENITQGPRSSSIYLPNERKPNAPLPANSPRQQRGSWTQLDVQLPQHVAHLHPNSEISTTRQHITVPVTHTSTSRA